MGLYKENRLLKKKIESEAIKSNQTVRSGYGRSNLGSGEPHGCALDLSVAAVWVQSVWFNSESVPILYHNSAVYFPKPS